MKNADIDLYITDSAGQPRKVDDLDLWSAWHRKIENSRIAHTEKNGVSISTIFQGMDVKLKVDGELLQSDEIPLLFETMIIGGEHDGDTLRHSTKEQALAGHAQLVAELFGEEFKL